MYINIFPKLSYIFIVQQNTCLKELSTLFVVTVIQRVTNQTQNAKPWSKKKHGANIVVFIFQVRNSSSAL